MKHLNSAAFSAGALDPRVQTKTVPAFPPVMRGALMPAIRTIRRDLGLSTGDLLVLGALLSFLPCKDPESGAERPINPEMVLVIFAGNAALCDRANGMDERVLRRHLARLCTAGLVQRKQSATGKRFPLKREGQVRDAFGIDLTPLLHRHQELTAQAREARRQADELRAVRAEALALRAEAIATADPNDQETLTFLEKVKTVLRRATLTPERVLQLIQSIRQLISRTTVAPSEEDPTPAATPALPVDNSPDQTTSRTAEASQSTAPPPSRKSQKHTQETDDRSGRDGRSVRHKDPSQIDLKKEGKPTDPTSLWARCQLVALTHPEPPETERDLLRVVFEFGQMTRFDPPTLAEAVRAVGPARLLETLDYIAQNMGRIRCPYSYLKAAIQRQTDQWPGSPGNSVLR